MMFASVPVELGFIASLSRPGGNVTGTTYTDLHTPTKFLEILRDARPSVRRMAVLRNPSYPGMLNYSVVFERAAESVGIRLQYFDVARTGEVSAALEKIAASRPDALGFAQDPVIEPRIPEVTAFARQAKLMSIGTTSQWAESGGLFAYSPDPIHLVGRTASYVDRILRGAKPADLPVEQPSKFEFVINLKTANEIGLKVPHTLLLRADRVIE